MRVAKKPMGIALDNHRSGEVEEQMPFGLIDGAIARVIREELRRMNLHDKRMLSLEETANYLGISEGSVYNLESAGKLHPSRYTSRPMFDLIELDRLIDESRPKAS